ncbi:sugar-binding transcriptional regulator [Nocardioides pyridinolyticus]
MTALGSPAPAETLRLSAAVARLYYVHGVRQREIGRRLGMSQARVSRLLRQAEALGIVRTVIAVPEGLHPELEDAVEHRFRVPEVHVVDVPDGADLPDTLGRAAARQLADVLAGAPRVGFTSWSTTLQALAFALPEQSRPACRMVVEMLGDLGSPALQHAATRSTQAMARALGADPVFLRTPGVSASPALRAAALRDLHVQRALELLDDLDVALVGVGPAAVHSQLRAGAGYFSPGQLAGLRRAGAAGQLNQRFYDDSGRPLATDLDDLVIGIRLDQLAHARRRIVVAGGADKHASLRAALRGGWIDVLVTDARTAAFLSHG